MSAGPILFYDGVCAFCNEAVRFVLRHDRPGAIRFAALQSPFAEQVLARHGRDARQLDTMCLLLDPGGVDERLLCKSDGILALLDELGGPWRLLGLARIVPRAWRDRAYAVFVRNRYRWFGRYDSCPLPAPEVRARFVDAAETPPLERVGG